MSLTILVLSIIVQFCTAGLAFRLNRKTPYFWGWNVFAIAFLLMGVRQLIPLLRTMTSGSIAFDLYTEGLALLISVCLLAGVWMVGEMYEYIYHLRIEAEDEIENRKRTEAELRVAQQKAQDASDRLRLLSDNLPDGLVYQIDSGIDGQQRAFSYFSAGIQKLHELTVEEALQDPQRVYCQVHAEDRHLVAEREKYAAATMTPFTAEVRVVLPSGRSGWRLFASAPRRPSNQHLIWDGIEIDITGLKDAEQALRNSEALFRALFENAAEGVLVAGVASKRFVYANPAICSMLGYSEAELLSMTVPDIHPRDSRETIAAAFESQVKGNKSLASEIPCLRKDGTVFYADTNSSRVRIRGESCLMGLFSDVTARRKMEAERQRMQTLEILGTVAGGIAHDFNNLLMGVFGNIELATLELAPDHSANASLRAAHQALENARQLTTRLLTFAKGGNPVLETVDIRGCIGDTVRFHLAGSQIAPQVDLPDDLWPVIADKSQLAQVVSNLTLNALQAMPDGGTFHVQARNVPTCDMKDIPDLQGDYVQIIFRDEGKGIPEHILPRIFDPYFTTKRSGSGLGLTITHSIIRKHRGHIRVDSVPDQGTTFTVFLPVDDRKRMPKPPDPATKTGQSSQASGHVLLMDDEPGIRNTASRMLARSGYVVETAADGREAIEKYATAKRNGRPFDLTIMDLTVPGGMGGREAVKEVLAIDPLAKVMVSSGYYSDPVLANYGHYGFSGCLAKPFQLAELEQEVSRVMKAPAAGAAGTAG